MQAVDYIDCCEALPIAEKIGSARRCDDAALKAEVAARAASAFSFMNLTNSAVVRPPKR